MKKSNQLRNRTGIVDETASLKSPSRRSKQEGFSKIYDMENQLPIRSDGDGDDDDDAMTNDTWREKVNNMILRFQIC